MYNILICDDEKDIVSALRIYLASEDYNLFESAVSEIFCWIYGAAGDKA